MTCTYLCVRAGRGVRWGGGSTCIHLLHGLGVPGGSLGGTGGAGPERERGGGGQRGG